MDSGHLGRKGEVMKYSDLSHNLRIELDMKNCRYSAGTVEKMEAGLAPLRKVVRDFPLSDLYITAYCHQRTGYHHVKTALVLTGRTLFTGDRDSDLYAAYHRCVRKLVNKVEAYIASLSQKPEMAKQQKGTHHEVVPTQGPDIERLNEAVRDGNYRRYRQATDVYEEPLRKRIGRWIVRYPELENMLGSDLSLADIVEEVFLNSFEKYDERPESVRFGQWIEDLIDPSIKAVLRDPVGELENIEFARTMNETTE